MAQKINLDKTKKSNFSQLKFLTAAIIISIFCLIIVSLMTILLFAKVSFQDKNAKITDQQATEPKTDSDGDGLPDQIELIYGTDPTKADSDGNGIKDGAQVKASLKNQE